MDSITEHLIETYARAPDSLDPGTRDRIEAQLEKSDELRALLSYWLDYFDEFRSLDDFTSPLIDQFVDRLFALRAVELRPLSRPKDSPRRITVLAALSKNEAPKHRFETIATLGDGEKGIVVRIVYDHKRQAGRLYVLSDHPADREHAIVSIPDLPMNVVTDESGQCEFQIDETGRARVAKLSRMLLRRSRAYCTIDARAFTASESRLELSSGDVATIRREANRLFIRPDFADDAPPFALMAAQWDDGTTRIVPIKNGGCAMTIDEGADHATIRFYY